MASLSDITIKKELRLCKVGETLGYFHCWEQYVDPGAQYSRVFGIVEFDDRIKRVDPTKIQFIDEAHDFLSAYSKMDARKEKK